MLDTVDFNHVQHISFTQSLLTDAVSVILSELLSYEHPPKPGDVFFAPSRRFLVHFYRTCTKQAAALVFRGAAVYNNIIRQDFSARKQINKRTDGAAERPRPGQRLKGKQVQFLYDLVTVNGEHSAFYVTDAVHREGGGVRRSASQETCRLCWYGKLFQVTSH